MDAPRVLPRILPRVLPRVLLQGAYGCCLLSGLSGSGKTTLGRAWAEQQGWIFIDGDWFFHRNSAGTVADPVAGAKPRVRLSDGSTVSHWDTPEAIDWDALNQRVAVSLQSNHVVLVTFMPRLDLLTFPVTLHLHLSMGDHELERCIQARRASKPLDTAAKAARDELVVRELVYPEYLRNCQQPVNDVIMVYYDDGRRKSVGTLLDELSRYVN
jgi:hypothetical protein